MDVLVNFYARVRSVPFADVQKRKMCASCIVIFVKYDLFISRKEEKNFISKKYSVLDSPVLVLGILEVQILL